jgi:predicted GIY-YIG superfamily endonuclease
MWTVYVVRCRDGSLYTGITNDLERRLGAHNGKTGGKYTRSHAPVELVYAERKRTRSTASRRENEIKGYTRTKKLAMIAAQSG